MEKREVKQECTTLSCTKDTATYVPFADGEMVVGVKVPKTAKVKIEQVENFAEVTTAEKVGFVALNYLQSVCLILTADSDCEVEILTVK